MEEHTSVPMHALGTGRYARKQKAAMAAAAAVHDMATVVGYSDYPGYTGYDDSAALQRRAYDALMPPSAMSRNPYEDFDAVTSKQGAFSN